MSIGKVLELMIQVTHYLVMSNLQINKPFLFKFDLFYLLTFRSHDQHLPNGLAVHVALQVRWQR